MKRRRTARKIRRLIPWVILSICVIVGTGVNWVRLHKLEQIADAQAAMVDSGDGHLYDLVLRAIAFGKDDMAIQIDLSGSVTYCNANATERLGIRPGENYSKIIPMDRRDYHTRNALITIQKHETNRYRTSVDGHVIDVDGNMVPVHVEMWTVPDGAMAFLSFIKSET